MTEVQISAEAKSGFHQYHRELKLPEPEGVLFLPFCHTVRIHRSTTENYCRLFLYYL